MSAWSNIGNVARREYVVRVRTRSFVLGTLLLIAGVVVIAFVPVIVRAIDRVAVTNLVVVADDDPALAARSAGTLGTLLNATAGADPTAGGAGTAVDWVVTSGTDLAAARLGVLGGAYDAVLGIGRTASGDLAFTYYSEEASTGRSSALVQQTATALAISDRLDRLGVSGADQATLFAPATFEVAWPDPDNPAPTQGTLASIGQDMLAFGLTILIFMIIIMYGNWVAMSVVEEKSSRVMEVVLNAATPFQLLAGKVLGVAAVALTQYGAVVVAGVGSLLFQGPVAEAVLGAGGLELPQGLSPAMLLAFGTYGVLGFLLYASLYAAAGSLVSRQEDVAAAVMPLTLLSTVGYMIGVYGAMGLIDIKASWLLVLTLIPLLSPFMMLGRMAVGVATPAEVLVSLALLVGAILLAIWIAARIYAVGVLLYGSRPGMRTVWRLLREGM